MRIAIRIALVATLGMFCSSVRAQSPATKPADPIQPQTVWTGTENGDTRVANRRGAVAVYASANILTRSGDQFTFEYWIFFGGARHGLEMRGQIRNNEVRAQATKVMPGGVWPENILEIIWYGSIDGDKLTLERTLKTNQVITSTLTLDPSASSRGAGRRGRRGG